MSHPDFLETSPGKTAGLVKIILVLTVSLAIPLALIIYIITELM